MVSSHEWRSRHPATGHPADSRSPRVVARRRTSFLGSFRGSFCGSFQGSFCGSFGTGAGDHESPLPIGDRAPSARADISIGHESISRVLSSGERPQSWLGPASSQVSDAVLASGQSPVLRRVHRHARPLSLPDDDYSSLRPSASGNPLTVRRLRLRHTGRPPAAAAGTTSGPDTGQSRSVGSKPKPTARGATGARTSRQRAGSPPDALRASFQSKARSSYRRRSREKSAGRRHNAPGHGAEDRIFGAVNRLAALGLACARPEPSLDAG